MSRTRHATMTLAALVVAGLFLLGAGSASAAPSDGYGSWSISPTAAGYSGGVALPPGFPAVTFTTDSRSPAIFPGSSAWLPAESGFGAEFGSSRGKPYVALRPKADGPAAAPSTTTFTFASPTPVGGWGFAIGDIDAEQAIVSATDAAGAPVPSTALDLRTFNYCVSGASASPCAIGGANTVPTATATPFAIAVEDPGCPTIVGQCDTDGEAAWIGSTVPLSTLTVTSTWKQGSPVYQAWFATVARAIGGTSGTNCATAGALSVQLLDGAGAVVATSVVAPDGSFSFPLVAARSDYTVRNDPTTVPTATSSSDAAADVGAVDATGLTVSSTCSAASARAPTLAPTGGDARLIAVAALLLIAIGIALRAPRRA